MATFAALQILEQISTNIKILITLGCPRIGNLEFAELVQRKIYYYYRIVHFKDPYVHLPLVHMGFMHAGTEIWYQDLDNTIYKICKFFF